MSVTDFCFALQERGSEAILGADSHIHFYEQGGISSLGGVHPRTVPNKPDGTMDLRRVEQAIRKQDDHYPITRLICIENTHNRYDIFLTTSQNLVSSLHREQSPDMMFESCKLATQASPRFARV